MQSGLGQPELPRRNRQGHPGPERPQREGRGRDKDRDRVERLLIKAALPTGDRRTDGTGKGAGAETCQGSSLGDRVAKGIWMGCPHPKIIS